MKIVASVLVFVAILLSSGTAEAKHTHHNARHSISSVVAVYPPDFEHRDSDVHRSVAVASIVAHPAGCPHTQFCGCGAAVEIFGRPVRDLWLAANWFRFPRAEPAPGMAAVRQHHVMVIKRVTGNNRAIVYDANSGNHLTRIHEVSLAGYSIRNPHGGRT
jgi:hypothetical protein